MNRPALFHIARRLGATARTLAIGLLILGLCLLQGRLTRKYKHKHYTEAYPFSHYPMYQKFDDFEYFVFLTDGSDKPIALEKETNGLKSNKLKKRYDNLIDVATTPEGKSIKNRDITPEQARPSGLRILKWLSETYDGLQEYDVLRLYKVKLWMKDGRVAEDKPVLIAEYPNHPAKAAQ